MKWKRPPHGGKYKLVATKRYKNDLGLIVLCPDRREYSWRNVLRLLNSELRDYLLSMQEGIEAGWYDVELLDKDSQ